MIRTLTLFAGMALLAGAIIYAAHPSTAAKRWQAEYNAERAQCKHVMIHVLDESITGTNERCSVIRWK